MGRRSRWRPIVLVFFVLFSAVAGDLRQCARIEGSGVARERRPRILTRGRRYAEAECYRFALAVKPGIPELQVNLALAQFKVGQF